jgi:hypothetical protein
MAPSYANIFMADFEEKHVYPYHTQQIFYGWFIDDIFGIWSGSRTELDNFISKLNQAHPTIRFRAEISSMCVSFLDTKVCLSADGTIHTDHTFLQNFGPIWLQIWPTAILTRNFVHTYH